MIKEIKKGDVLLLAAFVAAALLIALSPLLRSRASSGENGKGPVLEVRVSGELYGTYDLNKDQTIEIQDEYGTNTLSIRNGTVSMTESDCRNQICVRTGSIESPGQMIVCLPHRLSAEITDSANADPDSMRSSGSGSDGQGEQEAGAEQKSGAAPSYDAISR